MLKIGYKRQRTILFQIHITDFTSSRALIYNYHKLKTIRAVPIHVATLYIHICKSYGKNITHTFAATLVTHNEGRV